MNDLSVPLTKIGAIALWSTTAIQLLGGWTAYLVLQAELAIMLGTSAAITGLGATTLSCRGYAAAVARLVRLSAGLPVPRPRDGRGLRSVGD